MKKFMKNMAKIFLPPSVAIRLRRRNAQLAQRDKEILLLPALVAGGSFVDIGANVGLWSASGAQYFSKVVAFEPSRSLASALRNSLPRNVEVISVALSDHNGTATFSTPIMNGVVRDTRATLEAEANQNIDAITEIVTVRTLDSFELGRVDLIKIDVEGHEEGVLLGAQLTIDREQPVLIIEIEERHHPGRSVKIANALVSKGYGMFYLEGDSLKRAFAEDIATLQAYAKDTDQQVNNFVFIHDEKLEFLQVKFLRSGIHVVP